MNHPFRAWFAAILCMVSVASAVAAEAPLRTPAATLIAQLDDPDYKVRNAAGLQLNNLSGDALPVVEAAVEDAVLSAESQIRLRAALKILRPRAAKERRDREFDAWELKQLGDAYRASGQTKPAYDEMRAILLSQR